VAKIRSNNTLRILVTGGVVAAIMLVSGLSATPALATPPTNLTNGQSLYPGQYLRSPSLAYRAVFDNGGHLILIRLSDGKHCASWPAPSIVHSNAHATYSTATQQILLETSSNSVYATVNGNTLAGGTTTNVNNGGVLYVGNTAVHGC